MRRGQDPNRDLHANEGWTKRELLEASGLSAKTFDTIRKAARIRGPGHGGLDWVFSVQDLLALIHRAESGTFSERGGPAAIGWRGLLTERGIRIPD
jgi:hypothetical protein